MEASPGSTYHDGGLNLVRRGAYSYISASALYCRDCFKVWTGECRSYVLVLNALVDSPGTTDPVAEVVIEPVAEPVEFKLAVLVAVIIVEAVLILDSVEGRREVEPTLRDQVGSTCEPCEEDLWQRRKKLLSFGVRDTVRRGGSLRTIEFEWLAKDHIDPEAWWQSREQIGPEG